MNRNRVFILFSIAVLLAALLTVSDPARAGLLGQPLSQSGAPQLVSYQGQVMVDGTPYTGTGYFKFAVVNQAGDTTYWSNDGTSTAGSEPTAAVAISVSNGLFNVLLGDTTLANMTALPASVFSGTDRYLRVWFGSDGTTFTLLSPDRRIAAVPYALQAEEAKNAATAGNAATLGGQQASAFASSVHEHDATYVNEGQADSVTSTMLLNGTITLVDIGQNGCTNGQVIQWNGEAWTCANVTGVTDHGALTGLSDDDHPQYFNLSQNETVTGIPAFNGGTSGSTAPFTVDSTFLVTNLNADLLDGLDASAFATASHNHDAAYVNEGQADSVTSAMIVNGTVTSGDLQDGATLAEIADDDGTGSGLDADLLDGSHASAFASSTHTHQTLTAGTGLSGGTYNGGAAATFSVNYGTAAGTAVQGNQTASIVAGDGLTGGISSDALGDGFASTLNVAGGNGITAAADSLNLGPLTANWMQTGGFDVVLANASSELLIMESAGGAFYGTFDVGDLGSPQTYTFNQGGTVWTSGNDGAGLGLDADLLDGQQATAFASSVHNHDATYVNEGQVDSVTSAMIVNGTVASADLTDGATLAEIADDDGSSSGLDADRLDGQEATAFASNTHNHDATYVNEGQANSVNSAMITDGTVASADLTDGATLAEISDDDGAGSGLDADRLDGQDGSYFQARVSGTCAVGSTIQAINADGTVVCQLDAPLNRAMQPLANTLTSVSVAGIVPQYTSMSIGVDGLPLISYYDSTNRDLKVVHCSDPDCSAATITTLDSTNDVGSHNSLTIGSDGFGLISYYYATDGDLKVAHCSNIECTAATVYTLESPNNVGDYTSITIGSDGFGLISYHDVTNGALKVAHCTDVNCSSANTYMLENVTANVGLYTSITVGMDGLGFISYAGAGAWYLRSAHCSDVACTSATTSLLDEAMGYSRDTSVTIGTDGLPLISFILPADMGAIDRLRIAHCNTPVCAAATYTTIDTTTDVDYGEISITIGPDGLALVSYFDFTSKDLKVAHCSDVNCTDAALVTVDSATTVSPYTSLTIGTDGLPMISYFDTASNLRFAHCSNSYCIPYFRRR